MDWFNSLRAIQVDPTSYCNASCGACLRNYAGGKKVDHLELSHFDFKTWERLWREDLRDHKIDHLNFNGNWGDAGMQPRLLDMIATVVDTHPETFIEIATNGGMRRPDWWRKLGGILRDHSHIIDFALDGLADTHSLYRRGTDFNVVLENARAFSEGGGWAGWIMTMFQHNVNQIEECNRIAKDSGFGRFRTRTSSADLMYIEEEDGSSYTMHAAYLPEIEKTFKDEPRNNLKNLTNGTQCPWYQDHKIQIDPWGRVFPCCHISHYAVNVGDNQFVHNFEDNSNDLRWDSVVEQHGNFNDLRHHSLRDILESEWYSKQLPDAVKRASWDVCKRQCGIKQ